jgi:hypothetical protein
MVVGMVSEAWTDWSAVAISLFLRRSGCWDFATSCRVRRLFHERPLKRKSVGLVLCTPGSLVDAK